MTSEKMSGHAALLRFLVRAGTVGDELAQEIETELASEANDKSVIDCLVRRGVASEQQIAELLSTNLRLPLVNLAAMALDRAVTGLVREDLAMQYQVVPVRVSDQSLAIATANPLDRSALRAVEFATGKRVHPEVATQTAVTDALKHAYRFDETLDAYLQGVPEGAEVRVAEFRDEPTGDIGHLMHESKLPPVVKLLNVILLEGLRQRASDVHVEAGPSEVRVRYRIDGILEDSLRLPKWVQDPLIARCKVLAKLDITERRVPQDGRIDIRCRDSMIDVRVSVLPTQFGEKITMRLLDPAGAPQGLDGLDFSAHDLKCIRKEIKRPEGMILVTGPTGSGKTTTLYAMIAEITSPQRNIVTIENPIEYQLSRVNQVQINEKQGLTFAGTLRSILRQDPDVILVGEIRDAETAHIALRAAQTGHLVLSTLHTNDAVSAITRLLDMGLEPYMLASSLHLIIAQRLVRRTCVHCAQHDEPDADALRMLQIGGAGHQFRRGGGCGACRKSGYAGRVGVFEVMQITSHMERLIEAKASESALRMQAREDGTTLLGAHAAARVCAGVTTTEEVLRVVDVVVEAAGCPACGRPVEDAFTVCPHCATALQSNCASCDKRLQKEWQTCPYCATPRKAASVPGVEHNAAVSARGPEGPREYRVLVVDDHADMRRLVTLGLEQSGLPISTLTAANGVEALERAHDDPPDAVVLDIMMPGMDGFEVCERLRANVRTAFIPILMLSARDDPSSRTQGFLTGTDDYLGKPFVRGELIARVRRLLERSYGATLPQTEVPSAGPRRKAAVVKLMSA